MNPNLPAVGSDTPASPARPFDGLPSLLPKLAQPWWYRLVGTDYRDAQRDAQRDAEQAMSAEARTVAARKARKIARRQVRLHVARQAELVALAQSLPPRAA